ncbi:MAG: type I-E CRISPR-associated protein Cas6/Cse3/CasE [Phycisphaerales bacterium]|nr:type I-E CRISPR-associated protein Cas6/Cse3/CasE [Phycisphaerales bacterium]
MSMFISCLLVDTGANVDRPRPGRLWLRNVYRVHQRLCMGFPTAVRFGADADFLLPFKPDDFGPGHVRVPRTRQAGFLFRVDPLQRGRAVILVQSADEPDWGYAFRNAGHLLAADPAVRAWDPSFAAGERWRFRLRANAVRRIAPVEPGRDGPRVPVPPTEERLREWLVRRASRAGFGLEALEAMVPGYVYMSKSVMRGSGLRLRSVLYEGTLRIVDPGALSSALASGIGPAKAFGFGLLSIAPVR